ncbi:microtubule-associated protein futsch isoform X5 [Procambarus clarkii]|uniref:microtubule-associated protein futsch isoform X5 n=1 Tax=Procambarus clarkii TaxID=6728 RepID=UPI0037441E12
MLSMCGLLCRMLRGWRHSEAVMLMAKALSQPHSSLLVQDIVISDAGGVTVNEPCGSSPFCQNSNEGTLGQQLWRDNNKQAVIISPKQCVDLQRWTLFLTSSDNPSSPSCKYQLQAANENGTYSTEHSDASGTITVLLEATYRDRDDEPPVDYHVMVEHLSQPYAWKARDVFGVIVTTTPPQLLAMIQAFFNNALLIDDDFLIKKIITIDVMGKPATMEDPLSIPQCVTPGPWNADRMSHTQMEIARSVSPSSYQGQPPSVGCGNVGLRGNSLRPPLLSTLMRHQSSGESATDTSTTINPQSSSDSDKHPSSLDPQSSYDSVSDYPTSEADDVPCNVYNFYPRGWAVSGTQIISGQPLSVRGVLTQLEGKQQRKPCSIVTNPMEDLWQEAEDAQKALDDSCTNEQSILCTNGPSQSLEGRSTLPRAKKIGRGCTYPYRCLQGSVLCKRLEQAEPGRKEREIVKEAAEYYQRALNSAQERKEWAKKSMSSASDEDTPLNEYSFSGIQNEAVVTHEPKKYPVRIKSDADLSRATSIIKDNLANIVQRYLVKSKNTPGCQYFHPKVSSENPTLKLLSVGDEPQHFVDEPSWMQDPDSYSASAQAIRDGRRVGITVVKTEVTGAELLRNIEQYDPTIAMDNTYQVDDHKYVSSRNEDKIFVGKQNINKTELRVESHDDLMSSDKLKLKVLPALTNQCPTKRIESNPKIWISSDKKLKNICAANCKQPVRSSGRSEKKLVKSDEIVAPTIKRESRIDIPFTTEDESKSITLCDQEKVKATTIRQATNLHTNKTPDKVFASHRMQVINTDLKKADETPTEIPINVPTVEGDKCFNKDCEKSDDKFRENMNQIPDKFAGEIADITGTCERIPSEIIIHSPDTISEEKSNSLIIKTERTLEMVQEKQENNASKVVMTAEMFLGTEREVQIEEKVKDFDQSLKVKETSIGEPAMESISYVDKTSDKIDSHADSVMLQKEIYSLSGATIEPNPITTIDDNYVVASQSADLCIESSMGVDQTFTDIPIILGVMLSSNHLQESEICDKSNHLITLENEDVAMLESSEVGEEASDTDNDTSTMKLTQRPKCLKDIHKLNTKSSTASESSFESLPYRMLTSQPDSLSEDIAIELTRAPPDSEKLKAARLELIRQERINAISLHSMSLIELKDDYRCKSVSPEEEFKADSSDIFGDISKSKSTLVDPKLEASPMYNEGQQEMDCSSMFDSGVEVLMHEQMSSVASSLIKSFPSPVESVPESGFSSLKEPLAYEGTTEDGGFENHRGVSFSKSKDSLDLTDTDRFPGTDTLSDDMETFSLSAGDATLVESGPVSTEGSARGSISDSLHQDNSLLKVYPNEPSTLYLDSVGIPITFIEDSSHYNFCEIHNKHLFTPKLSCSLDSTSSKSLLEQFCEECESQEVEYSCKEVLEVLPDIPESNHIVRLAEKAVKCVPEDGNGLNIKTSESLSSEDTVVSRMSFEDRGAKFLSQESLEEPIEVSEPLKISPNDVKDEKIKDLIDVTVNVVNENVRESVDSVAEISINTLDGVNKVPDSHGLTTIIPKGQHTESLPEVLSVCKSEKYLKQVDAKLGVVKEQVTNSKGDQVSELNVPFIVKETNLDEDSKSLTVIEQNEIKATCEVANEFPNVGEYSETGSLQNNIELHLSIADKLKLLNDSELVDPSIKEDSYAALDTKYPDQVIENISHQSEKSNEMELNSIASSVVITQSKEIKKEDKAICNSDVIVSVTSDTSRKSDVSEKSSPNANETCSTGTSDRPSRHSSKSGISDLEDEVFLPPKENYIFDGRPVIYCPKIDMANQIGISPPKVAMSVFAVVPSKHVSVHKGAEWIAANKDDFPKFPSYPVLPEPARNLNMEEKEITDKSVTQSLDIISLATSEPAPKDYSTNISSEVHFVKEDMEPCTTSVNVLNIINGTYKQGLHGCTKQAVGDKVAIINDSSEEYILKIKNEDTIACTEILNDNKNLAAAELQQPNNMVKGCPENIVQKEFQNTNAKLTRHTSISSPTVTKESMRKGGHQSHSLDKVIDAECIPRRDIKFIVDEEKNYKYLHENKSEFKREEISSTGSLLVDDSSSSSRDQINKFNICQLSEDRALGAEHEVGYPGTLPLKEMGEHVKPKLLRMSNLERTDTTASPTHCMSRKVSENSDSTPQESPVLSPVVTHDKMKVPFSFTCLPVDAYSSSSPVSREATDEENSVIENKIDIDLKLSTKKFDEETNSNAKMSENSVENILSKTDEFAPQDSLSSEENGIVRRESQDEEITKEVFMGSEPELKKYGSEESSLLTLDSHGSSTSKGYLEPDLRSVSSSWGASGSLECLDRDKSEKGSQSRRHGSITTAKSEELGMKCDQVSLKSQGSLDKFPHFDQVTSQQKARGARKKILSVDIEKKEKKDLNKEMHRSVTLPAGSMVPSKKDDKKKEKEEKSKKKKKDKEGLGNGEKKSAMLSLKGLLKRNKSKEKEKERDKDSSQEKLSSPSLFRKLERKTKSNFQSPRLDEWRHGAKGLHNAASSNPNLQRNGSPFVRGVPHSSSFTSSPFRRPHSSAAVFSPAKRVMSTSAGGSPSSDATPGAPLMRVEEEGPCRKNLDNVTEKPPNVLVYAANKTEYFTAVKETLLNCLNVDRYTIYQLTDEMAFKSPWAGSTTLLVVCGDVPAHVSTVFIRYLLQGGRVFSVCSDFLNMAVPLFAFELPWTSSLVASGTVEVQEQAVVSISYRRWSSVHLLHHQHCFHSSPQHKRFSQDMENIKGKDMRSAVSVEPTHVEIIDEYGGQHRLDLKILATDDTWGAPSLLSAKVHDGKGSAVFSQVHLERDPRECFATSGVISKLAISNEARLEILRDLLSTELSLDTTMSSTVTTYSPAYFLGRHELKQTLLNTLKPHMEGQELKRPQLTIQFVTSGMAARQADETVLPLLMSACPLTFSTVKYFEALKTSAIGRLVIYCDVMTSSMKVTAGHPPLIHGIVVLPTQQTHGKGRSGNSWLSPLGCVMFTSQLHIALSSNLGQHLTFLQHLAAMAIVQAVREHPGYADIPIHLKWPNDIYIGTNIKIGGVIVEATTVGSEIIANVGCGVNLSNSNPTYCINDAIRQHNKEHNTSLSELDRETFLARIFNYFEDLIETFQVKGPGAAQHIYYKYWLHSNATVTVQNEHRRTESAVIVGVDNYGFLEAQLVSGTTITLQPDGNSFNMMDGLIYSKLH